MDRELWEKLDEHSVAIARLEEGVKKIDEHVVYRFDRLEVYFKAIDRNTSFRKKVTGGMKTLAIVGPICIAVATLAAILLV